MTHPKKVWHRDDDKVWHQLTMEAIDANHAVAVDPENWSFEKPAEPVEDMLRGAGDHDGETE